MDEELLDDAETKERHQAPSIVFIKRLEHYILWFYVLAIILYTWYQIDAFGRGQWVLEILTETIVGLLFMPPFIFVFYCRAMLRNKENAFFQSELRFKILFIFTIITGLEFGGIGLTLIGIGYFKLGPLKFIGFGVLTLLAGVASVLYAYYQNRNVELWRIRQHYTQF